MGLGSTNVKLNDIYGETIPGGGGYSNSNVSLNAFGLKAWTAGPPPHGDNSVDFYGSALKTGIQQDILYNPVNNGASAAGSTTNIKMGYYKNFYGIMDGTTYYVDLYVENNLPVAGRGDPPNDVTVDMQLIDYNDAGGTNLCGLDSSASEGGGTNYAIKSNSSTFNVYYCWVTGGVTCLGLANYNLDTYVNGNLVYSNSGLNGSTQQRNYTGVSDWSTTPVNGGAGFSFELYFA